MRQLSVVGLVATGVIAAAGLGLLLLLAAVIVSAASRPSYHADFGTYPGGYADNSGAFTDFAPPANQTIGDFPQPLGQSPADRWLNGNEIDAPWTGGTIDTSGEGNHVIGLDGEVLNLP